MVLNFKLKLINYCLKTIKCVLYSLPTINITHVTRGAAALPVLSTGLSTGYDQKIDQQRPI